MVWRDICLNKYVKKEKLAKAVAYAFEVSEEEVFITSGLESCKKGDVNWKVMCQTFKLPKNTEFQLKLDFYINDNLKPESDIAIYAKLISTLQCALLVDNCTQNLNTMLKLTEVDVSETEFEDIENFVLE